MSSGEASRGQTGGRFGEHDSQVAIPLAAMTAQRVTVGYELMDAGYHREQLQAYGESLGPVVLIPEVERQNLPAVPMAPAEKQRYRLRMSWRIPRVARVLRPRISHFRVRRP
jgi:hypothetical protein